MTEFPVDPHPGHQGGAMLGCPQCVAFCEAFEAAMLTPAALPMQRSNQQAERPTITCPDCGWVSAHPVDVAEGYCARCCWWTSVPHLRGRRPYTS